MTWSKKFLLLILVNSLEVNVELSSFPDELRLADIIPVHKKGSTTDKANYRPFSLLPGVSKVFERLIKKQIEPFINTWFTKHLCGFCTNIIVEDILCWTCFVNGSRP